jgi:hypothetical protein
MPPIAGSVSSAHFKKTADLDNGRRSTLMNLLPPLLINVYARSPDFIYQIVFSCFFDETNYTVEKQDHYIYVVFFVFYYIYVGENIF